MARRMRMMARMPLRISCLLLVLALNLPADNSVLDAWLRQQSGIKTLEADFIQERKLAGLKKAVSTPGKLSFARPGRVRWELGDPPATLVLSDGSNFTLIDHTTKTARRVAADSPHAARFGMLTGDDFQSPEKFHAMFEVAAHRVESGIHQYTLKPRDLKARKHLSWVFLDIDPRRNELRAMEIELKDKSRIRTIFQQPRFNHKLPDSHFTADLSGLTVK
jgi:outer membrane lipoprotein-sorting protein